MSVSIAIHPENRPYFGAFIRQRRRELNLRPFEVAFRGGLSPSAIDKLEQGQCIRPRLDTLQRIAAGLEIPTQELITVAQRRVQPT